MQNIPQEQIDKRFQTLSDALQEAIFSQQSVDVIQKSCVLREAEKYITKIALLTGCVLLGYLRPENFAQEIQKETGMDAEKAAQVAHDLDTEIFSGVRLELKKLYPPTIQTPTVQSPGFAPLGNSVSKLPEQPKPAPRYVVQIPEKFLKQESGIRNKELGMREERKEEQKTKTVQAMTLTPLVKPPQAQPIIHDSPSTIQEIQKLQSPKDPLQEKQAAPSLEIKPVVPLPTFIHTKFKDKNHE